MGKHRHVYPQRELKPTTKAVRLVKTIAASKGINLYEEFSIFEITSVLQDITIKAERVSSRIDTTKEVLDVIKYIRSGN